jgi:predicted enzyme related to lactoylglutathione lyase
MKGMLRMIKGISVLFVPSRNIEESKQWYADNLGFEWKDWMMHTSSAPPIFFIESNVCWNYRDVNDNECAVLSFIIDDADQLHKKLLNNNVIVEESVRLISGIGKEFWFIDPSGNRLLVTQPL